MLGLLSGAFTLAGVLVVLKWLGWAFYFDHWHNVAGTFFMCLCVLLVFGGIFNQINRSYVKNDWNTKQLLLVSSVHKYFGYFIIFAVQLAVITGIYRRTVIGLNDQPKRIGLIIANVVFFFGPIAILEIIH